ncbi:MAG: hypothetical protein UT84_C0010G0005 [Candidatus Curtissbacteria bacterium GW2011_GWA1_40_16]|uniref:Glycosyltransferase RgtA/B/C/D-like domain-containing protein n=1 Tax=Candidatus Curtissbacteria bacterium GW2011_GWA1_40_16 TaxID=1618405 RepID=A0A0G0UK01_9BACT|nr:MAG: hypothetical protein UT84_C0010G0005 [Candidatus Curtissbacteria bacterium GW2011_GWA1_40_16]
MKIKKSSLIFTCTLIFSAFLSIVLRWNLLNFLLTTDEGAYAYITYFWQQGNKLYTDVWLDRPQGIFLIYRLVFNTFGDTTEAIRLFAAVYNSLTVIAIGALGKKLFNWQTGAISAFLFTIFSSGIAVEGFTANTELFINLPAIISIYFLLRIDTLSKRNNYINLILGGLFAGLPFLIKGSGISAILFATLYTVYLVIQKNKGVKATFFKKDNLLPFMSLILGFTIAIAPAFMHGFMLGIKNYLWGMIGWRVFEYNILTNVNQQLNKFLQAAILIAPEWTLIIVLFVLWLFLIKKNTAKQKFVLKLFLSTSFLVAAMGGQWHRHYFVQILPALSLIGGAATYNLINLTNNRVLACLLTIYLFINGLSIFMLINAIALFSKDMTQIVSYVYNNSFFPYNLNDKVANYITNHTDSTDTIYVFFSQSQIYYLTKRKPAYPITFTAHVLTDHKFEDNLISIIESQKGPKYLVNYKSYEYNMKKFPKLKSSIDKYYFLDSEIEDIQFLRKSGLTK